jgi:glycosyltransferase involved in cell wall biosynthesis
MFDILICSWNNLEYLKLAIRSIKENSFFSNVHPHSVYVHVQEGTDGTPEYLDSIGIKYNVSDKNIGLCKGTNGLSKYITKDWVCLIDDDMYMLPDWDKELLEFYIGHSLNDKSWLSSVMIEPMKGPNTTISPAYYGHTPKNFDEERILNDQEMLSKALVPMNCNQATPLLLTTRTWKGVKGYEKAFDPGIGSEEGLAKKVWDYGGRNFVGVPRSLVYHFQCKTTGRIPLGGSANRDKEFMRLHGITVKEFLTMINWRKPWVKR